jgi:hypothetical protein
MYDRPLLNKVQSLRGKVLWIAVGECNFARFQSSSLAPWKKFQMVSTLSEKDQRAINWLVNSLVSAQRQTPASASPLTRGAVIELRQ